MSEFFIYYTESNIVCFIIFGIMLFHDLLNIDRQEKQLKFDRALMAFMGYFISDTFWGAIIAGVIPATQFNVVLANLLNFLFMAGLTYAWLDYVLAMEQYPNRNRPINRFAVLFPFILSTIILCGTYILAPGVLVDEEHHLQPIYNVFQICVPLIYIMAVLFYSLSRAGKETNPAEKRKHLYIGIFPMLIVSGGLIQILLLPRTPVFCFSCTILMLIFYIQNMNARISKDPLTSLNNRGQLLRYVSQENNIRIEGLLTYVVMIDVNDFKSINDTFGHAEGDRALLIIADSLKAVAKNCAIPLFLGRYGGDEFILIAHPEEKEALKSLIIEIREQIHTRCRENETPYILSIGAGYDELAGEEDSIHKCMKRADQKLYQNKEYCKANGQSTILHKSAE